MKLFRTVRRNLLISNNIKKYLLYAFGEILLIVVGILIAWKISNYNELRKNKIIQEKIYISLYEELHTNLGVLNTSIFQYKNNTTSLQNSLNYVGFSQESLTREAKDLIVQVKFKNTNLRSEALSSVNFTDKFQFLESDTLADLIAEYSSELKRFEEQELKIRFIVDNRLKPVLEEYISLTDLLPDDNDNFNQIRAFGQKSNYIELLNNKEYQNSVIDQLLQTQIQLNTAINLRNKTEKLAIKLKQELDG